MGSVSRGLVDGQHEFKLAKEIGPPNYLFETSRFNKVFMGTNMVYIGHNRSKTVGDNVRKNAHPFMFDDVMGAHNGTLDWQNKNRLEAGASFKTDSEALFNTVQVHGITDTISRVDASEAYALTWFDRRDGTMNFLRNDKRPLVYCTVNEGKALFWASEYGMLLFSLYREGISPDEKPKEFLADHHFKFTVPLSDKDAIGEPVRTRLENHKMYFQHFSKKTQEAGTTTQTTGDSVCLVEGKKPEIGDVRNGLVYGGLFVGWQPPKKSEELVMSATNSSIVDKALAKLGHVAVDQRRPMTADDILRRKAFDRLTAAGLLPVTSPDLVQVFNHSNLKVWRNKLDGEWRYVKYNSLRDEWALFASSLAPEEMPYTLVDINARHCFEHRGRKKRKRIFYKAFNKVLLDRHQFEQAMSNGCACCGRSPEWGNEVVFCSPQQDFLCEHCALTPGLIDDMLKCGKPSEKKAA